MKYLVIIFVGVVVGLFVLMLGGGLWQLFQ